MALAAPRWERVLAARSAHLMAIARPTKLRNVLEPLRHLKMAFLVLQLELLPPHHPSSWRWPLVE